MVHRGDHSSSPGIAPGIQQPTRGFSSTMAFATANGARFLSKARSASRAGSPLLFGLAPRGVFRASGVATGAVGSYPTFSPLPNVASILGVAQVSLRDCHSAAFRRRSILCGTFRDAVVAASLPRHFNLVPWRYQARCPCHEFPQPFRAGLSASANGQVPHNGVRTFLPVRFASDPAITRLTRHSHYTSARYEGESRYRPSKELEYTVRMRILRGIVRTGVGDAKNW